MSYVFTRFPKVVGLFIREQKEKAREKESVLSTTNLFLHVKNACEEIKMIPYRALCVVQCFLPREKNL